MSTQTGSGPQMTEDYHEQLGKLLLLLELEQEALKNRQFDTIDSCTKDKEEALRQLELLEQKRLQFIQNQGRSDSAQAHFETDEQTLVLLSRCRELNTVNGGIVEISRQFNQRMLESILGLGISEEKLYDETGNKPSSNHPHVMAKI